jgi:hypothetical protein
MKIFKFSLAIIVILLTMSWSKPTPRYHLKICSKTCPTDVTHIIIREFAPSLGNIYNFGVQQSIATNGSGCASTSFIKLNPAIINDAIANNFPAYLVIFEKNGKICSAFTIYYDWFVGDYITLYNLNPGCCTL